MNERKYTLKAALLVWDGDPDMPHDEVFDLAQAFATEARKRGLFDEPTTSSPRWVWNVGYIGNGADVGPLDQGAWEHSPHVAPVSILSLTKERDEARKLVAEMAVHFQDAHAPKMLGALKWITERDDLIRRAKEMTNDCAEGDGL